jgi:hypothetical protein
MELPVTEPLGSFVATNSDENINLITKYQSELSSLHKKTYEMLDQYNVTNIKTTTTLLDILNTTSILKKEKKILEQSIGLFSFKQNKEPIIQKNPPFNSSAYVSVLFARIKQYHNTLTKNEFITPTLEQITQFKKNEAIVSACNTAIDFGLYLNLGTINAEKEILTTFPKNVAFTEFQQLLDDIAKMIKKEPHTIKTLAETLYAPKTISQGSK